MSSSYWKEAVQNLRPPRLADQVHREECTQCFDNQDSAEGLDVCLTCFNGGCNSKERHHALTHYRRQNHPVSLNIRRSRKPKRNDEEPPLKRLAIREEREEDNFTWVTTLRFWPDEGKLVPDAASDPKVKSLVDGVLTSMSSARQSEVKAWEEEIEACEHTLTLQQDAPQQIPSSGLAHCSSCDLTDNLWLCLSCGALGCGRPQHGGKGGNGHGLAHYEATKHPVSVKLGTITAEGTADAYCYDCNDSRLDLELERHLANFGINIQTQTKTEKTMTELQIEQNFSFEFSLTDEDGKALKPLFGAALTGISNLGNSCYMASTLQGIFALPSFQKRYTHTEDLLRHSESCKEPLPALCVECQMFKVGEGLISGRYSVPDDSRSSAATEEQASLEEQNDIKFQAGVRPSMFKSLIGKGHPEFSTMRQQDAEEFFTYLLKILRQYYHKTSSTASSGADLPTDVFRHGVQQRLECQDCHRCSYRVDEADVVSLAVPSREAGKTEDGKAIYEPVEFVECLDAFSTIEPLEYSCPSCSKKTTALKQATFSTTPDVLVVHMRKFQLVNWVPQKLNIEVRLPESDQISLESMRGNGQQPGEELLPESAESGGATAEDAISFDEEALNALQSMGFPLIRCQKALLATGNSGSEQAMEWLFQHMEDPDIDDPIVSTKKASGAAPSAESVSMIVEMGFTEKQASKALKQTDGNAERAVDWLFNHPEDDGSDDQAGAGGSTSDPTTSQPANVGGSKDLPATYRLKAFISHKGPSVHSGHYVAHVRQNDGSWVFFNDEKVVAADEESVKKLKALAYLYIFERV